MSICLAFQVGGEADEVSVGDTASGTQLDTPIYGPDLVAKEAAEQNTASCLHTGISALTPHYHYLGANMVFLADAYSCAAAGELARPNLYTVIPTKTLLSHFGATDLRPC